MHAPSLGALLVLTWEMLWCYLQHVFFPEAIGITTSDLRTLTHRSYQWTEYQTHPWSFQEGSFGAWSPLGPLYNLAVHPFTKMHEVNTALHWWGSMVTSIFIWPKAKKETMKVCFYFQSLDVVSIVTRWPLLIMASFTKSPQSIYSL